MTIGEKGEAAEKALAEWLKREGFAYVAICQQKECFAPLFTGSVKRPDFLVLLESVGMIAVDVKNYALHGRQADEYTLKYQEEFRRAVTFERIFRLPFWYAYWNEAAGTWHWISALKAVTVGDIKNNTQEDNKFLAIKLKHFELIASGADFGKLYTHRLPDLRHIHSMPT